MVGKGGAGADQVEGGGYHREQEGRGNVWQAGGGGAVAVQGGGGGEVWKGQGRNYVGDLYAEGPGGIWGEGGGDGQREGGHQGGEKLSFKGLPEGYKYEEKNSKSYEYNFLWKIHDAVMKMLKNGFLR